MERQHISSSNISSVGYDIGSSILEIEFSSNDVYQFFNVPENVYRSFLAANSHGQYFYENIKDRFEFKKIN